MKYNGVIQRKLAILDEQVVRLRQHLAGVTAEQFAQSWALRSMTERALQVAVEIVIDIAERIIAIEGAGPVPGAAGQTHARGKACRLKGVGQRRPRPVPMPCQ